MYSTIPDAVLDQIAQHRPHLQLMIDNLHNATSETHAAQIERHLAFAYLHGETRLSALDTWYLAQVSYGGPWGGDWVTTEAAAAISGYDAAHIRRLAGDGKLPAMKRGKVWYVRRDKLPLERQLL